MGLISRVSSRTYRDNIEFHFFADLNWYWEFQSIYTRRLESLIYIFIYLVLLRLELKREDKFWTFCEMESPTTTKKNSKSSERTPTLNRREFFERLYELAEDDNFGWVRWGTCSVTGEHGKFIRIETSDFERYCLRCTQTPVNKRFNAKSYSTFKRQLTQFGFRRVTDPGYGCAGKTHGWVQSGFECGRTDLLEALVDPTSHPYPTDEMSPSRILKFKPVMIDLTSDSKKKRPKPSKKHEKSKRPRTEPLIFIPATIPEPAVEAVPNPVDTAPKKDDNKRVRAVEPPVPRQTDNVEIFSRLVDLDFCAKHMTADKTASDIWKSCKGSFSSNCMSMLLDFAAESDMLLDDKEFEDSSTTDEWFV